jgi:hypothetical protein
MLQFAASVRMAARPLREASNSIKRPSSELLPVLKLKQQLWRWCDAVVAEHKILIVTKQFSQAEVEILRS